MFDPKEVLFQFLVQYGVIIAMLLLVVGVICSAQFAALYHRVCACKKDTRRYTAVAQELEQRCVERVLHCMWFPNRESVAQLQFSFFLLRHLLDDLLGEQASAFQVSAELDTLSMVNQPQQYLKAMTKLNERNERMQEIAGEIVQFTAMIEGGVPSPYWSHRASKAEDVPLPTQWVRGIHGSIVDRQSKLVELKQIAHQQTLNREKCIAEKDGALASVTQMMQQVQCCESVEDRAQLLTLIGGEQNRLNDLIHAAMMADMMYLTALARVRDVEEQLNNISPQVQKLRIQLEHLAPESARLLQLPA